MAAGKIHFKSDAGGITSVSREAGATNGELVLPSSGTVVSVAGAVTDNAIARYDSTTGKLQNSGVVIDDMNDVILKGTNANGVGLFINTSDNSQSLCALGDASQIIGGAKDTVTCLYSKSGVPIVFTNGSSEKMRIDSAGNVGIGVTPSDWQSQILKGFDLGDSGSIHGYYSSGTAGVELNANAYMDNTGNYKYKKANAASRYSCYNGYHYWLTAPSGTAGNPITWTNAMTLDAMGTLILGANAIGGRISITGDSSVYGNNLMVFKNNPTTNYGNLIFLNAAGTQVGYIQASSTATAYVTSSDYRLKEDWKPMENSINRLMQLKPCNFKWKETGTRVDGFLAHELQEVAPEVVTGHKDAMKEEEYEVSPKVDATYDEEGNELTPAIDAVIGKREVPDYQGIDQSKLVPLLTASLQDAVRMIEDLKSRIEILEGAQV